MGKRNRISRRYKRKNKRRTLTKNAVLKLLNGERQYLADARGRELSSLQDKYLYQTVGPAGTSGAMKTIIESTGRDALQLGDVTDAQQLKYQIFQYQVNTHFRNVSNHDCFMEIYECICRKDTQAGFSMDARAMQSLVDGWDAFAPNAAINNTGTGTDVVFTSGNTTCSAISGNLTPFKSRSFTKDYKIANVIRVKLKPGDDLFHKQKVKSHVYDPLIELGGFTNAATVKTRDQIGGVSRFLLIRLRGALGKCNSDDTLTGYVKTDVAYELLCKAKVRRVNRDVDVIALKAPSVDTLGACVLEAPTEYNMANENL